MPYTKTFSKTPPHTLFLTNTNRRSLQKLRLFFRIRDFDYFIRLVTRKVIATVKIPYNSGKAARIRVLVPTS